MKIFKDSKIAFIVMLAVILGSSSISAVGSINSLASKVEKQFYEGSGNNLSIYNDIIGKTEDAYKIMRFAQNHLSSKDKTVESINGLISDITSEKSIDKLYSLVQKLDYAVEYTAGLMNSYEDKDFTGFYKSYNSRSRTIDSDPYNQMVKEFNDEVNGIPGSIFKLFAHNVEYFK